MKIVLLGAVFIMSMLVMLACTREVIVTPTRVVPDATDSQVEATQEQVEMETEAINKGQQIDETKEYEEPITRQTKPTPTPQRLSDAELELTQNMVEELSVLPNKILQCAKAGGETPPEIGTQAEIDWYVEMAVKYFECANSER